MKIGPTLVPKPEPVRCGACPTHRSEYYCVEDGNDCDSGFDHYCDAVGGKRMGHSDRTPEWCPGEKPVDQLAAVTRERDELRKYVLWMQEPMPDEAATAMLEALERGDYRDPIERERDELTAQVEAAMEVVRFYEPGDRFTNLATSAYVAQRVRAALNSKVTP